MKSPATVSYTHLDVYKRQEYIRACYALCDNFKLDDEGITCMREAREKNSLPIDSVAKACRVSVNSIYRIEQGNTMISTKHLITYHNLFLSLIHIFLL